MLLNDCFVRIILSGRLFEQILINIQANELKDSISAEEKIINSVNLPV